MKPLNLLKKACAVLMVCTATTITLHAQTFGTLYSFDGTDGRVLPAPLIQGTDGNFYGVTEHGGSYQGGCIADGCGTIFKLTPGGTLTTLHSFSYSEGAWPLGALIQATDGDFYGTTESGGAYQYGAIFRITPSGAFTTIYNFCSQPNCLDGRGPLTGLVQGVNGNLYGTTPSGGASNSGSVFKLTLSGAFTSLYDFSSVPGCSGCVMPNGLIQGTDGNFYGTTGGGGANYGGSIFKITPSGVLTTLYSFCAGGDPCTDGEGPKAALIQATDGNLYGTTYRGGASSAQCYETTCGTVFTVDPTTGTLTTLHSFEYTDGGNSQAGLIQANDGNFYGTTAWGGAYDWGTIFEITPSGTLTSLHSFDLQDGASPEAALVQGTNGKFYGEPSWGGEHQDGTIFMLVMGLPPFLETEPAYGKAGKVIKILGTNLTGATSVTFNGTPAVFKLISNSLIGATVPAGATTGTVQVTTPSGTLSSNVPFRVKQ
jgi:uncharacterized repeat protein (TIGR03803 family)